MRSHAYQRHRGLLSAQKEMALKLFTKEAYAFARDDNDIGIGYIPDLELDLDLENRTPVQKNYVAVPKPLYPEAYIEDLLNRNFIKKSIPSYSSPIVCAKKKDQSLRLCVDFRALSEKTRPEGHPIRRMQEMLNNLGGNSWFSVLDQGKAYHQRFMSPDSQPLTAFLSLHGAFTNGCGYHLAFSERLEHSNVYWKTVWETCGTLFVYFTWMTSSYSVPPLRNRLKVHVRSFND